MKAEIAQIPDSQDKNMSEILISYPVEESETAPLVSVIIPCWNAEKWVARAIQSVLDQDYPQKEIIVIDDGSTDSSLEIIKSFGDKIRWETGPNRGACPARNRGLALATGKYIQFLDADDYLDGPVLRGFSETVKRKPCDLILGRSIIEHRDGSRSNPIYYDSDLPNHELIWSCLNSRCIQTGGQCWSRTFLEDIGAWDERVRKEQDIELVLRAIVRGANIGRSLCGWAVWFDHNDENRISKRGGRTNCVSGIEFRARLGREAKQIMPSVVNEFGHDLYRFARFYFIRGDYDLARRALLVARELGFRGREGPWFKRALEGAIGLELTERIARAKRDVWRKIQRV